MSIVDLPREILVEILLRLRVKNLLGCKCVCKPWRCLISDPKFIKLHFDRSNLYNLFLDGYPFKTIDSGLFDDCEDDDNEVSNLTKEDVDRRSRCFTVDEYPLFFEAIHACNGLLYLYNGESCLGLTKEYGNTVYMSLLNPATREQLMLPSDPSFSDYRHQRVLHGFGHDPVAHKYKVVRFICGASDVYRSCDEILRVMVYDIGSGSDGWRMVENAAIPSFPYNFPDYSMVRHVNGVLHWVNLHPSFRSILSFDLSTEKFGVVVPFPDLSNKVLDNQEERIELYVVQGCLSLVCTRCPPPGPTYQNHDDMWTIEIWIMREYGVKESWALIVDISGANLFDRLVPIKPLFIRNNDQIVLQTTSGDLLLYHLRTNAHRLIIPPWPYKIYGTARVKVAYVEGLTTIASLMAARNNDKIKSLKEEQQKVQKSQP